MNECPECLIVTTLAAEFADEVRRLSGNSIPVQPCVSADAARAAYAGHKLLFGSPAMIAEVLDDMPTVDWVQSSWAGVTPLIEAARRDYRLTGVKNVFGPQMAEYVLGHLLAHELKILDRRQAQSEKRWWRENSGTLGDKHLCILGTGSIGSAIATAAKVFDVRVTGVNRSGRPVDGFDETLAVDELGAALPSVDYLVSTLPDTPATTHLLDATMLARLPRHAVFINVGRANVIDHDALADALDDSRLAAAILDVFDEEPLPAESRLWATRNLTVTAHIAAVSHPLLIVPVFVDNYARYLRGDALKYEIEFARGY